MTEIILMNVHNMTILAKVCHVKLNNKVHVRIYLHGGHVVDQQILACLPMSDIV